MMKNFIYLIVIGLYSSVNTLSFAQQTSKLDRDIGMGYQQPQLSIQSSSPGEVIKNHPSPPLPPPPTSQAVKSTSKPMPSEGNLDHNFIGQPQFIPQPSLNQTEMNRLSKEVLSNPYIESDFITLISGPTNGLYYPVGGAICRMINRNVKTNNMQCAVAPSPGSVYNIEALKQAKVDFAIIQSDLQSYAYDGVGTFHKEGKFEEIRFVFTLYDEAMVLIVRNDSNIKSLDDIAGKVVNIGHEGSGIRSLMDTLMQIKGWDKHTFSAVTSLTPEKQINEICNHGIDVMALAIGNPNTTVQEALNRCDLKILNIDDPEVKSYISRYPEYITITIPAGMYIGEPQDIKTFGSVATLVTSTDTSTETVYKLVKSVFEHLNNFRRLDPVLINLTVKDMVNSGKAIPYHPGAIKYYQEKGYIN